MYEQNCYTNNDQGWGQQDDALVFHVHTTTDKLLKNVRTLVKQGVSYDDLEASERALLAGLLIKSLSPIDAWDFISEATESERYPYLLADSLVGRYGGYLGVERTANLLMRVIKEGAISYAEQRLRQLFDEMKTTDTH